MNLCNNCRIETINPKYCSRSCAAKINNLVPKRKRRTNLCATCSLPAEPSRKFCNACFLQEPKDMTLKDAMYDHLHKSSAFALIRSRARAATKDRVQKCAHCGYSRHVQCCHIKAIKDFPLNALVSVVNHPDNLILLCPNCHWELDHPSIHTAP